MMEYEQSDKYLQFSIPEGPQIYFLDVREKQFRPVIFQSPSNLIDESRFTEYFKVLDEEERWQLELLFKKAVSHNFPDEYPEHILCTNDAIYAGYNGGEWGGALFRLDKRQHQWENISHNNTPVTGILQSPENHVLVSYGLDHLGLLKHGLYEWDSKQWNCVIPDKISFPEETDITGIAFTPTGELCISTGTLGLFVLKGENLNCIYSMDWDAANIYAQK